MLFVQEKTLVLKTNGGYDNNIEPEIRNSTPAEMEYVILNFNNKNKYIAVIVMCLFWHVGVQIYSVSENIRFSSTKSNIKIRP